MPKFNITVVETVSYEIEIEAYDQDAARQWAMATIASEGTQSFSGPEVLERDVTAEEV